MRGPIFDYLIKTESYTLDSDESLNDLEKMYTLLIESRGKSERSLTTQDERITLITLCQISFPGKTPKFMNEAKSFRKQFKGISESNYLELSFKKKINNSFKRALNENNISFDDIGDIFLD